MRTITGSGSLEGGLKAMAEPTRFLILAMLAKHDHLNVSQIATVLGINQAGVSQHLRVLRYQGIVEVERDGQWAFYKLVSKRIEYILDCIQGLTKGSINIPDKIKAKMEVVLKE
jgi:ArsR family transcriptional regulator